MLLRKIIFLIFIFAVVAYAFYTARGVLFAPGLTVFYPKDGEHIAGTQVDFSGKTIPKVQVWVDGAIVESDEKGYFSGSLFFHPGYNEMGIRVQNRFGKESKKVLKFVVD